MQIIYGYSNCTDKKYREIVSKNNVAVLMPDQKYHGLLIKGFSKNDVCVKCLSGLPVNRAVTKKKLINEKDEQEGNAYFHYYTTLNIPGVRQGMIFAAALWNALRTKKTKETYAICDCLNIANAYGMLIGCKLRKIPIITIVTDLPDMMSENILLRRINNSLFNHMNGFIFLTEQMNQRLNKKNKPYIVLEGHVDSEARYFESNRAWELESGKKIVIYAGSIFKLYGIQNLVEGFLKASISNAELWIYGDGDYRDELIEIAKTNPRVKYFGVKPNAEIVNAEMRAALLVNPRPIAPEYTKYSFPSKNMEYMVSGTPLLTTRLPGMPKEYYPFIYLINDESPEGIANVLTKTLNVPFSERKEKAERARDFVMKHKTNVEQARKIARFLKKRF